MNIPLKILSKMMSLLYTNLVHHSNQQSVQPQ